MKQFAVIFLAIMLVAPLYAQEIEFEGEDGENGEVEADDAVQHQQGRDPSERLESGFARQNFEIGINVGAGFDNDLLQMGEIFRKNIVIDLDKLGGRIGPDGLNLNLDVLGNIFFNARMSQDWGFGLFIGVDGAVNANLPKSLLMLPTEGNTKSRYIDGDITASGGVFANVELNGFVQPAKLGDGKWRIGFGLTSFTPLIYIPGSSGIHYVLDTRDSISLLADGAINVYSPFSMDPDYSGGPDISVGFDLSVDVEYPLFDYLNLRASLSAIPLIPSTMKYQWQLRLDNFRIPSDPDKEGLDLLGGDGLDFPDLEFNDVYNNNASFKVHRPLRFDVCGEFQPLMLFLPDFDKPEMLIVVANLGFTADITGETGYFNFGLEVQTSLVREMIFIYLGTGLDESIWNHRLGFAFNFRAFELALEGSARSQGFGTSFQGAGYGVNLGLRFGW